MVGRVGFEPTTNGLKGHCSTAELPSHIRVELFELFIRNILKTVKQMFENIFVLATTNNHHIVLFVKQILTLASNQKPLTGDAVSASTNNVVVLHCGYILSAV